MDITIEIAGETAVRLVGRSALFAGDAYDAAILFPADAVPSVPSSVDVELWGPGETLLAAASRLVPVPGHRRAFRCVLNLNTAALEALWESLAHSDSDGPFSAYFPETSPAALRIHEPGRVYVQAPVPVVLRMLDPVAYVSEGSVTGMTSAERAKLAGVQHGAEANVQADWSESDPLSDAFIRNRPKTVSPSALAEAVAALEAADAALGSDADGLAARVSALESGADGLSSRVSALESDSDLDVRVSALESAADGLSSRVSALESDADLMEGELAGLLGLPRRVGTLESGKMDVSDAEAALALRPVRSEVASGFGPWTVVPESVEGRALSVRRDGGAWHLVVDGISAAQAQDPSDADSLGFTLVTGSSSYSVRAERPRYAPTRTSQVENDSGFITDAALDPVRSRLGVLERQPEYAKARADWSESDESAADFIMNKPDIAGMVRAALAPLESDSDPCVRVARAAKPVLPRVPVSVPYKFSAPGDIDVPIDRSLTEKDSLHVWWQRRVVADGRARCILLSYDVVSGALAAAVTVSHGEWSDSDAGGTAPLFLGPPGPDYSWPDDTSDSGTDTEFYPSFMLPVDAEGGPVGWDGSDSDFGDAVKEAFRTYCEGVDGFASSVYDNFLRFGLPANFVEVQVPDHAGFRKVPVAYLDDLERLVGGAPEALDTLRELADLLAGSDSSDPGAVLARLSAAESALDARPTKAQMDVGWWSDWAIKRNGTDVTAQVQQPAWIPDGAVGPATTDVWFVGQACISGDEAVGAFLVDGPRTEDADALAWTAEDAIGDSVDYTATRHRVAAPVPAPSTATPLMDGTASAGSSASFARGDHVHPSDTSRYVKPSGGIPKNDLASGVKASLGKADTAAQPYPFVEAEVYVVPWHIDDDIGIRDPEESVVMMVDEPWYDTGNDVWKATFERYKEDGEGGEISHTYTDVAASEPSSQTSDDTSLVFELGAEGDFSETAVVPVVRWQSVEDELQPFANTFVDATEISYPALRVYGVGSVVSGSPMRDLVLVIEAGAVPPTVAWPASFAPRTSAEDDLAVEEGTNVYYITEYAEDRFVVARWLAPEEEEEE